MLLNFVFLSNNDGHISSLCCRPLIRHLHIDVFYFIACFMAGLSIKFIAALVDVEEAVIYICSKSIYIVVLCLFVIMHLYYFNVYVLMCIG